MTRNKPRPPDGLRGPGRALWRSVVAEYDLFEQEIQTLLEACRSKDTLADLQAIVDADGLMVDSPQGRRMHPALVELRQQKAVYLRLMAGLRLPVVAEDEKPGKSPVRTRQPNLRAVKRGTA